MPNKLATLPELETFFEEGWITDVLYRVKSGKEATVYCCRADGYTGLDLVAAKVYRSQQQRNFKNDTIYREDKFILDKRLKRAFDKKTRKGREVQYATWMTYEFETLTELYNIGAAVPQPFTQGPNAILMSYIGDAYRAAPLLHSVELEPEEAQKVFQVMLDNIELWLKYNKVHGDLSPFNVLYWEGQVTVIDFPQAVDPRFNRHAYDMLLRDVTNIYDYLAQFGVVADPQMLVEKLWWKFQNSQL